VKTEKQVIQVNVLQFANYTLFVGDCKFQNIFTIKSILRCFELASGLRVNFHKSIIRAIGVERGAYIS